MPTAAPRGLCRPCYGGLCGTDKLADYPPLIRRREDVVADWKACLFNGCTKAEAARRIGMKVKTLERALTRARRAGMEVPYACSP